MLPHVVDEGATVEPEAYVPVLPLVLCNGAKGVATGWSTDVPMHNPLDVSRPAKLAAPPRAELVPWFRGFRGEVVRDGDAFVVRRPQRLARYVLDVPPVRQTEDYKEAWMALPGRRPRRRRRHRRARALHPSDCATDDLKALGLEKRLHLTNMNLLDAEGRLRRPPCGQIVEHHGTRRFALYGRLATRCARTAARSPRGQGRLHQACLSGAFDMRAHADEAAAAAACAALGIEGEYDTSSRYPCAHSRERAEQPRAVPGAARAPRRAAPPDAAALWQKELGALRAVLEKL